MYKWVTAKSGRSDILKFYLSMRHARGFILIVILAILVSVGYLYTSQREAQLGSAPAAPPSLPGNISTKADGWYWSKSDNNRTVVEVRAKEFQQNTQTQRFELQDVDLKLFHKDGNGYDAVKSARAEFDMASGTMFSEGDVEMRMGLQEGTAPSGRLMTIRSSGVQYDSKTGKVKTGRPASFQFDRGKGKCVGAEYDPTLRELRMFQQVELLWTGSSPGTKPMQVETGNLLYKELEAKVYLSPWSKLKRDTLTMDAGNAVVTLKEGVIDIVEAEKAKGVDQQPARRLEYEASSLFMQFDATGEVKSVRGQPDAHLVSTTATSQTDVRTDLLDLTFNPLPGGAQLLTAAAHGRSQIESRPAPGAINPAETRVLKSDVILLHMRTGGDEIEKVETHSPGTLEFLPNRAGQRRRLLTGQRIAMDYGAENVLKSFRAVDVTTRTEGLAKNDPPAITSSKQLQADFDGAGVMKRLEQSTNFRYEEGTRKAQSDKGILDYPKNEITLEGNASRVWDDSGSTTADRIVIDQGKDTIDARGRVSSTRNPEKNAKKNSMLNGSEALQAKADRMTTSNHNQLIRYEGNALLWQGADRIEASTVEIDRRAGKLSAKGKVVSQFVENKKTAGKPDRQFFTVVRAPEMFYEDSLRLAIYYGGAVLNRDGLVVNGREIRAYLVETEGGTSLSRALADGDVRIVQTAPDRQRVGTSDHAEYYTAEEKIILREGQPTLTDSVKGVTRGRTLTYFANNDKLIVDSVASEPARSRLKQRQPVSPAVSGR